MATGTAANDGPSDAAPDNGPLRTCAVTRRQCAVDDLIRFVAGPDGAIVPDLAHKLPGRGVWVTADRKSVETAVKTKAFNRSLKREVLADAGLAGLIERLLCQRALAALSLANKAGQVATGFTKIDASITAGTVHALLHGIGAGADGVEKLDRRYRAMCRDLAHPPHIVGTFEIEQMSLALGRANVVHAALMKGGAARNFLLQADRLEKFRT